MSQLRPIDPSSLNLDTMPMPSITAQLKPVLKWINIADLVVDAGYQRDIARNGKLGVARIAAAFDWCKFSPVIVAAARGSRGRFAIIDGQHRTTAAALVGAKTVPCQIIDADYKKQAAAFADINAQVTAMSTMQLHAARVQGGDPQAVLLDAVCKSAGVTILRYPLSADKMVAGQTLAAAQLLKFLSRFGKDTLAIALRCITVRPVNVGLVKAPVVHAILSVLDAEPDFAKDEKKLLAAMGKFDLVGAFKQAREDSNMSRATFTASMVDAVAGYLDKALV